MRDEHTDISFERMLIIGGILIILLLAAIRGEHTSSAPIHSNDSHNVYTETHTTNVDICGICINTDR